MIDSSRVLQTLNMKYLAVLGERKEAWRLDMISDDRPVHRNPIISMSVGGPGSKLGRQQPGCTWHNAYIPQLAYAYLLLNYKYILVAVRAKRRL